MQICRVEDIDISGLVQGSVINFNRARSVTVQTSGTISATGLGIIFSFLQKNRGVGPHRTKNNFVRPQSGRRAHIIQQMKIKREKKPRDISAIAYR